MSKLRAWGEMKSEADVDDVMEKLNGTSLDGRIIKVQFTSTG